MKKHTQYLEAKRKVHMEIAEKHKKGSSYTELAKEYDLSTARIYQILKKIRNQETQIDKDANSK